MRQQFAVLSLGAGIQSTALAILLDREAIPDCPKPDWAIFAFTEIRTWIAPNRPLSRVLLDPQKGSKTTSNQRPQGSYRCCLPILQVAARPAGCAGSALFAHPSRWPRSARDRPSGDRVRSRSRCTQSRKGHPSARPTGRTRPHSCNRSNDIHRRNRPRKPWLLPPHQANIETRHPATSA